MVHWERLRVLHRYRLGGIILWWRIIFPLSFKSTVTKTWFIKRRERVLVETIVVFSLTLFIVNTRFR